MKVKGGTRPRLSCGRSSLYSRSQVSVISRTCFDGVEHVGVEHFVPMGLVEAFDERVLVGRPGLDEARALPGDRLVDATRNALVMSQSARRTRVRSECGCVSDGAASDARRRTTDARCPLSRLQAPAPAT